MLKKGEKKGALLVLTTAVISGLAIFLNKFGIKGINPYVFTGLKNSLVAFFIISLILAGRERKTLINLNFKNWLTLLTIGLIGGSIPFLLFFKGITLTTAAQASFIHKNMFLIVAFLSPLFLKEKLSQNFILAALLLLLGNILLLGKALSFSISKGSLMILLATFFWALENIISKNALETLPVKIVIFGRMFFGSLIILFFLGFTGRLGQVLALKAVHWLWLYITSAFLFGFVYTWYSGLKHIRVSVAVCILTLGAPITSLLSLVLGKSLGIREILGMVLLILGIIILLGISSYFKNFKTKLLWFYERY